MPLGRDRLFVSGIGDSSLTSLSTWGVARGGRWSHIVQAFYAVSPVRIAIRT